MSNLEKCAQEIQAAQLAGAKAQAAYSKGGSVDAVNRADRRLADAHAAYREVSGGNAPVVKR